MMRTLIIWAMLLPLPLNGLWMVCNDTPGDGLVAGPNTQYTQAELDCFRLCLKQLQESPFSICIISPDGKPSLTVFTFGIAVIPASAAFLPAMAESRMAAEPAKLYMNASLLMTTPPPRA